MSKRSGFDINAMVEKKARLDQATAGTSSHSSQRHQNPYLQTPVQPEKALHIFLTQCRTSARKYARESMPQQQFPIQTPFCEVEVRLGLLKVPRASPDRRVCSSGAKRHANHVVSAFDCSSVMPKCQMEPGVSRLHFQQWTQAGVSDLGPLALALGVSDALHLKRDLVEVEYTETVYAGYVQSQRVCFAGEHPPATQQALANMIGKMETKEKLTNMDFCVPAASYDIRIGLASEKIVDAAVQNQPPPNWTVKRIKRRRSYSRRDKSIAWQIDVTEVTTTYKNDSQPAEINYEIELELIESVMLQLVNEESAEKVQKLTTQLAQQLWWVLSQLNPLADPLNVEETLRDHPNGPAVRLALAQCGALKHFMDAFKNSGGSASSTYDSPIGKSDKTPKAALSNIKFPGCMPVNFSRHNLDEIQRSSSNAYYLSEKTDGVRHLLVFTGDTAVLVDRAMRGKQPVAPASSSGDGNAGAAERNDPFAPILSLIQPGTVFDGEVVMNRRGRTPRPIFIVFDVLSISTTQPVLHLPFEERLRHLKQATFRTPTAARDMFDPKLVADLSVALPLVRKNFVARTDLDELLSHVVEERGMRIYRNGDLHNHLTDGIIFQPNRPYVMGTDVALFKWKYLDTMTIDLEMLPLLYSDGDNVMRVGCLGEEQTMVDMTRHVSLPRSERMKLEADRFEDGGNIAEVGFDPETGEWYYLTMRSDKIAPNHIGTVLGTLLELSENLTTEELRYRMSVPAGTRDTYRKDLKGMLKQLLSHQRKKLQSGKATQPN
ncbi:hypothetical protein MPSEU_000271500 [Mayamaea pseudoterrestris]|nr:hypothetical protein MPSEU_000271500 [Mayamaea pseudoterrestris]